MPEETIPSAPPAAVPLTPRTEGVAKQQANIAELLALARNFLADQQETSPPVAAEPSEPETRTRQRFQRYNPEAAAAATPAAPDTTSAAGDAVADPNDAQKSATATRRQRAIPANIGASPTTSRRSSGRGPLWFSLVTLLAGFALGWFLQPRLNYTLPPAEVAPTPVTEQSGEAAALVLPALPPDSLAARAAAPDATALHALALVDDAFSAEKTRDFARATRLYEEAYQLDPRVPAAARRLSELALLRNDAQRALIWNNRAFAAGDSLGAAFAQRGVLGLRAGNLRAALSSFTAATRAEPQSARWCFFLAQALRRGGKLQEALVRLRQAAERADEQQQEGFFQFIARLTQIELGETDGVATETSTRLQTPNPPADWVLTAAALELQRSKFEMAANRMTQLFQNQPPNYAATRLDDVFFRKYENEPELVPLYAKYLPRGTGSDVFGPNRPPPSAALVPPGTAPSSSLLNPTYPAAPQSTPAPAPEK